MNLTLVATTTMGFESVLAREIKGLGVEETQTEDGKVTFKGDLETLVKANLWLRTAGRIYIQLAKFYAFDFDELFEGAKKVDWETYIPEDFAFPITKVTSKKSTLFSRSDCQSVVKKAIVDRLLSAHKATHLTETGPEVPVRIQIDKDEVILSIDSSGWGLNKRGYRAHMAVAPLRETLAAGLLLLSRWRPTDEALMDPFCGTGTILIEGAMMAKNIAPGINREFGAESWPLIPKKLWNTKRQEAKDLINHDAEYRILGSDSDYHVLNIAKENIGIAGLTNIHLQKLDACEIGSRYEKGKIVTNPPYGERLSEQEDVEALYEQFGKHVRTTMPKWSYCVLTSHPDFEKLFGRRSDQHRKVYNGGMQCYFYQYFKHFLKKKPK